MDNYVDERDYKLIENDNKIAPTEEKRTSVRFIFFVDI